MAYLWLRVCNLLPKNGTTFEPLGNEDSGRYEGFLIWLGPSTHHWRYWTLWVMKAWHPQTYDRHGHGIDFEPECQSHQIPGRFG